MKKFKIFLVILMTILLTSLIGIICYCKIYLAGFKDIEEISLKLDVDNFYDLDYDGINDKIYFTRNKLYINDIVRASFTEKSFSTIAKDTIGGAFFAGSSNFRTNIDHVYICDINKDGKMEIVIETSQENVWDTGVYSEIYTYTNGYTAHINTISGRLGKYNNFSKNFLNHNSFAMVDCFVHFKEPHELTFQDKFINFIEKLILAKRRIDHRASF